MIQVGLTGNVASGKSAVGRIWAARGIPILDADLLAREAVQPGSPGLAAVREAFGEDVIAADGTLDRARMREIVFRDPEARRRLERVLHPLIASLHRCRIAERANEGTPLVVSEVPLLFETGLEDEFDVVVFVDAPEAERLRRLVEERGLAPAEARSIMASQGDPAVKRSKADHVLDNDGSLAELEAKAIALLGHLRGGASA
ncbi:MAG: dephospho-CoA kinase [Gemmatimonadota bacterium]